MGGLALRGLAARKLRATLTAVAILLGVSMVAGTFMLKASVDQAFDDIFAEANAGIDVRVVPATEFETGFNVPRAGVALKQSLLDEVEQVEGVASAAGGIADDSAISILGDDGEPIGPPAGGPPQIAQSVTPEPFNPFTWIEGRPPEDGTEIAVDSIAAAEEGFAVGDTITVVGVRGAEEFELSGIGRFGSGVSLGGASFGIFTLPEAQALTGKQGELDEILVEAEQGTSPEQLATALDRSLPKSAEARTGAEDAAEQSADIKEGFGFLTTILLVFAGISLFVGAFLIFNTFSITVAQRVREFGMLRTLGASSRQILGTVLVEALSLGVIASVLGIAAGLGFVALVVGAFKAMGFDLPQSGIVITTPAVVVSMIVGIVATLGSAIVPALRATKVTPLEALREDGAGVIARSPRRNWIARIVALLGAVLILAGLFGTSSIGTALPLLGLGLIVLFVGVAMLAGSMIGPLASLVGRPIQALRGVTARLARENTLRNPSRTATTSAALMIGVALVVFAAVFATSATKSVGDALDETFAGDLIINNADGFSPISPDIADRVESARGVEAVSPISGAPAEIEVDSGTKQVMLTGLDPETLTGVADLDWTDGNDETLRTLGPDGAIVESKWATDNGVEVGETLTLTAASGERVKARVEGSVRDRVALIVSSVALPIETLRKNFDARQDFADLVAFTAGADFDRTHRRVTALLADRFPQVDVRSQQEFKQQQEDAINQVLGLIYALLALSVIVSLFGVVNTLVLTIYERTREIGMLRAIGASRSQIRRMIRYESLITAMIGAIIGAVLGVVIAIAAVQALREDGLVLGIPLGGIIGVLVLSGVAGVVAGIWPARRAAKIEVMEALHYE